MNSILPAGRSVALPGTATVTAQASATPRAAVIGPAPAALPERLPTVKPPATSTDLIGRTLPASLLALQKTNKQMASEWNALPDLASQTRLAFASALAVDAPGVNRLLATDRDVQTALNPVLAGLKADALGDAAVFWESIDTAGVSRSTRLSQLLVRALSEEASLKVADQTLDAADKTLLDNALKPGQTPGPEIFTLALNNLQLAGAFVISDPSAARLLLYVPGRGLEHFDTRQALFDRLKVEMDGTDSRGQLIAALPLAQQAPGTDLDNALEEGVPWTLQATRQPLAELMVAALRDKQRQDIESAFTLPTPGEANQQLGQWLEALQSAADLGDQFSSEAMLERRDQHLLKDAAFKQLPTWLQDASDADRDGYATALKRWQTGLTELNRREEASSPQIFLREAARSQIAVDLGLELDPDQLQISTDRSVPLNGDTYQQIRSLTDLALTGLQRGDERSGSDFIRNTTLSYHGKPLGSEFAGLTPGYLSELLAGLPGPLQWRAAQRQTHTLPALDQVAEQRLLATAKAAQLRHILEPEDLRAIQRLSESASQVPPAGIQVNAVKLAGGKALNEVMVISHGRGEQQRWLLYTPGAPRDLQWQPFINQYQLRQEMVAWSADAAMSAWLLEQSAPADRPALAAELALFKEKPYPQADFFGLVKEASFTAALDRANRPYLNDFLARVDAQTPDWYAQASLAERQELTRLNEGLAASVQSIQRLTRPVEGFDRFLHEEADKRLNALLGLPPGTVDPDTVVIKTDRETLTYTRMLRDGYDDTLGWLTRPANLHATFSGPPGVDLRRLSAQNVAGSVRGAWAGDRYIDRLKTQALDPTADDYEVRRSQTLGLMQWQMQAAALTSQMKGDISAEQAAWLNASLTHLDDSSATARHRFAVDALYIDIAAPTRYKVNRTRPEALEGLYVFTQPDAKGAPQRLIYTPHAPDGVMFRDYQRFQHSLRSKGMPAYYRQRASTKVQARAQQSLDELARGTSRLPLPTQNNRNLRDLFYNDKHLRAVQNVEDSTFSRQEMIRTLTLTGIELVATALLLPVQLGIGVAAIRSTAALGHLARTATLVDLIALGGGTALLAQDAQQAIGSLARGDAREAAGNALKAALGGLFLLLDIASLGVASKPAKHLAGRLTGGNAVKAIKALETPPVPKAGVGKVGLSRQPNADVQALSGFVSRWKADTPGTLEGMNRVGGLRRASNVPGLPAVQGYLEAGSAPINNNLRYGTRQTSKVRRFLAQFEALESYTGESYRAATVSPQTYDLLKNGAGKLFVDPGVQSASITEANARRWYDTWAVGKQTRDPNKPVVYIFDETLPQKNLSDNFLQDHVAVAPGEILRVKAVEETDGVLFVRFGAAGKEAAGSPAPVPVRIDTGGPEIGD